MTLEWAKGSIEALAARGILEGTDEHAFGPRLNVTRAEFLEMLMLALALDLADSEAASTLTDAAPGDWYYSSVVAAQQANLPLQSPGQPAARNGAAGCRLIVLVYPEG